MTIPRFQPQRLALQNKTCCMAQNLYPIHSAATRDVLRRACQPGASLARRAAAERTGGTRTMPRAVDPTHTRTSNCGTEYGLTTLRCAAPASHGHGIRGQWTLRFILGFWL